MNYLAHIFLSGPNRKVQLGNFVGDAVKGSSYKNYPPDIAKGIQLHRAIDDYTDHHPAVCEVVHRLQPEFGRYSGGIAGYLFRLFAGFPFRVVLRSFLEEVYPDFLSFPPHQLPLSSATVQTFHLAFYPDRPFAEIRHSERNKRVFEHHGGISSY